MIHHLKQLPLTLAVALSAQACMSTAAHAMDVLPGAPTVITYPPTPFTPNGNTVQYGPGYAVSRQSTFSLSADELGSLDTAKVIVSDPGNPRIAKDLDGYYVDATFTSTSTKNLVKLDDTTGKVLGLNIIDHDVTFTAMPLKSVSSGGTLTIHDLSVSLTDHTVYASLDGGNGAGSQGKVAMFTYDPSSLIVTHGEASPLPCYPSGFICDDLSPTPPGTQQFDIRLNDAQLYFTQQGRDVFAQSLGFLTLGRVSLPTMSPFGTASLSATVYAVPDYFSPASVPEPGSMALMGLGLIGVISLSRSSRSSGRSA